MDLTAALELPDVPESLLVVGGGYIGLEMATVYAVLGSRVSVVEMTDGLLPGADRDLVKPLHKKMEKDLAAILLNTKVASLADKQDAIEVTLEGDVANKVQRFSRVLVAVGRRPNSTGLGLRRRRSRSMRKVLSPWTRCGGQPIRGSWQSATWQASPCSPTRRPMKARWRRKTLPVARWLSPLAPFPQSCSPTRKSPGRASPRPRRNGPAARSMWRSSPGPPAAGRRQSAAPKG